ncbi:unnamed protein product [Medioppia subpectinata]|uniref:Protein kinase domain-containing protein n=1 Tax=Medioppia subpectinata TaxID=1979941 RepID=A0A7R9KQE4_9ACAR|nr:unnamed protein product [Medioppia subpectinata]CAG2106740.1 unnamed protein product [Medioppia subpectinata]
MASIYCSSYASFAITSNGHVFSWGRNHYYNLGHIITPNLSRITQQLRKYPRRSAFLTYFDELGKLGSGTFGTVYKVKYKDRYSLGTNSRYAIKVIEHDVSSEYVVQYLHCSLETDNICRTTCIITHLYDQSLTSVLDLKGPAFGRRSAEEAMNLSEYYISCQLFKELLECIQYLHDLSPAVIHRDLKPDNVLVSLNPQNGRYLKLCDFGLAVLHERSGVTRHTGCVGTSIYMASEVRLNKDYTTKVDVYSLAVE